MGLKECFIIGSGPSYAKLNVKEIRRIIEGHIVSCNFTFRYLPRIDSWIFLDGDKIINTVIRENKKGNSLEEIKNNFKCDIISSYYKKDAEEKYGLQIEEGFGYNEKKIHFWTNSGYFALNYALHLNFDRIYLIGFDCSTIGWVEGTVHPNKNCEDPLIERMNTDYAQFKSKIFNVRGNPRLNFPFLKQI